MPEDKTLDPKAIEETVGKLDKFVQYLIGVLSGKNWTTKLLLLDVLLFAVFNPVFFPKILELFTDATLPRQYKLYFWLVISAVFAAAVIAAWRARPKGKPFRDPGERSTIKGLLPFGFADREIFKLLQRETDLTECSQAINDRNFRFGVLSGESGAGKTSFLQAGLWPMLLEESRCVYVKFTDHDPVASIKQAFAEQKITIPETTPADAPLSTLLADVAQSDAKSLVLLLDQFEQFFVHFKRESKRRPFIRELNEWYRNGRGLPIKILICIRGDFLDHLSELQEAMGYSLGPQQKFRLKKFRPEQAAAVFRVIADTEKLDCDDGFIKELTEQELAGADDGLISPVDVQILAWMIAGQAGHEERAFNRTTFQKLGGVEGLLERFLTRALEARETPARRQAATKVLLALTDLDRNARAGALTLDELKKKLGGALANTELKEAVEWLSRGDVRLIAPVKLEEVDGYELAHERLIPALRRIAGKELSEADRASLLLDRRFNEWTGNNRDRRYRLTWRELRSIKKQTPFIQWEPNRSGKDSLITASWRQILLRFISVSLPVLLAMTFASVWYSQWGQLQIIKWEVAKYSSQVTDSEALLQIAKSYVSRENFDEAFDIYKKIEDPKTKLLVLCASADELSRLGGKKQALEVLQALLGSIQALMISAEKQGGQVWLGTPSALQAISASAGRLEDRQSAKGILNKAIELADRINVDHLKAAAYLAIAESWLKIGEQQKADELLRHSRELAQKIDAGIRDSSLRLLVVYLGKFAEETRDARFLEQAKQVTEEIKEKTFRDSAWKSIVYSSVRLAEITSQKDLLLLCHQYVEKIERGSFDVEALCVISESAARLGDNGLSMDIFQEALQIVERSKSASEWRQITTCSARIAEITNDKGLLDETQKYVHRIGEERFLDDLSLLAIFWMIYLSWQY
ncbi:MAG: hypothetical protein AB7P14_13725 [Blastocatellales bacterium]